MLLRPFLLSSAFVGLCLLAACSDTPSHSVPAAKPAAKPAAEAAEPEPVLKTSGVLRFDGLPPESISAAEVLIVSSLSDEARQRLLRQRELFEYKITGRVEAVVGASAIADVLPADGVTLEAGIAQLPAKFPPVRVADVDLGNNRLRKFQSDPALFKEYKYLFGSIKWDNMERGLTFISEKIETDNKGLVAQSAKADDAGYQQASVTLKWLKSVQQHYNAYVVLAKDYFDARNRYLQAQAVAQSKPAEPTDWDAYVAWYANTLIMDASEHLLGAAFAAEDGSFEVEGHGIVLVRVELGVVSAYFLPGSEKEQRVRVENLQQL